MFLTEDLELFEHDHPLRHQCSEDITQGSRLKVQGFGVRVLRSGLRVCSSFVEWPGLNYGHLKKKWPEILSFSLGPKFEMPEKTTI